MKKTIALLLALALTLGIGAASADSWLDWLNGIVSTAESTEAEPADTEPAATEPVTDTPSATGLALQALLDENGLTYTYDGKMSDDSDSYYLSFGSDSHSYEVDIYLLPDGTHGELRIWNLIDYEEASFSDVLLAVDELNGSYKYTTFQTDRTDNSVTVSLDLIYPSDATPEQAADVTFEAMVRMVQIVRQAWPTLEPYNK